MRKVMLAICCSIFVAAVAERTSAQDDVREKCAAEWKALQSAGGVPKGMKWPQFYSECAKSKRSPLAKAGNQPNSPSTREEKIAACVKKWDDAFAAGKHNSTEEYTPFMNACLGQAPGAGGSQAKSPQATASRDQCTAEFNAKRAAGDLAPTADLQGYLQWCVRQPVARPGQPSARPAAKPVAASQSSGAPDESAVSACVSSIQARNSCSNISIVGVQKVDRRLTESEAIVIADVSIRVDEPFSGGSQVAASCTGTHWDMDPDKVQSTPDPTIAMMPIPPLHLGNSQAWFIAGQGLRVRKTFVFQKYESGWRCANAAMSPVDAGFYLGR